MKRIKLFESNMGRSFEDDHKTILDDLGYSSAKEIGRGTEGVIYKISPDKVIKIGQDRDFEYAFYDIDEHIGRYPNKHFTKVYETGNTNEYLYSIKELVDPWKEDPKLVEYLYDELKLPNTNNSLQTLYHKVYFGKIPAVPVTQKYFDFIKAVSSVVLGLGIDPDIAKDNVGYNKSGDLVAFDV